MVKIWLPQRQVSHLHSRQEDIQRDEWAPFLSAPFSRKAGIFPEAPIRISLPDHHRPALCHMPPPPAVAKEAREVSS